MNYKLIPFFLLPILSLHSQSVEVITIDWQDYCRDSEISIKDSVQIKSNIRSRELYLADGNGAYCHLYLLAKDPDLEQELWPEIFKDKWLWTKNEDRWKYTKKLGKDELIEIFLGEGYKVVSDTKEDFKRDRFSIYRHKDEGTVRLSKNIEKKAEETAKSTEENSSSIPGLPFTFKWTNTQGEEIEAYYAGIVGSTVTLLWEGKFYPIPLDKLSEESRNLAMVLSTSQGFKATGDPFEISIGR